jgi:cell division protease FtsH
MVHGVVALQLVPDALLMVCDVFMRQMQVGGGKAMSFGRAHQVALENQHKVTFSDVAGVDEAKDVCKKSSPFSKTRKSY